MSATRVARALPLALAVSLGFAASPAVAATTGEIRGVVLDAEGKPVDGALVEVRSKALMRGGTRSVAADRAGRYRFGQLPPGVYDIEVSHPAHRGRLERGVLVEIDRIDERPQTLGPLAEDGTAAPPEEVQVREKGVDPRRVATGRVFTPSFTDKVVTERSATGLARLVPGVLRAPDRGADPMIHGGSPSWNLYRLEGLWVSDPSTNRFTGGVNFDSIRQTQVLTGGLDAEYGYTTGGLVNVVAARGQDTFDFDASMYWAPSQLQLRSEDELTQKNAIAANIAASGPILPRRLWFYTSVLLSDDTRTTTLAQPVFLEAPFMPPHQVRRAHALGRLTWRPWDFQMFGLLLEVDPTWTTNALQEPTRHPRAERQVYEGGLKSGLFSETRLSKDIVWDTKLAYSIDRRELSPASNQIGLPGHVNLATGTRTINDTRLADNYRSRVQIDSSITTFVKDILGEHLIKAGVQAHAAWNVIEEDITGGAVFLDRGLDGPGSDISGNGDPYRQQQVVAPVEKFVWGNAVSGYIQDTWNPFPNLTLRPGIRFDSVRAYTDVDDGGQLLYHFNWPSPRFGASWDPFGDGRTSVRAGYFHYVDVGTLDLPGRVGRSLEVETYEYNPATGKYDIFVDTEAGDPGLRPSDDIRPPIMHELLIGASREIFEDASVHADLVFRYWVNLFEDTESNVQWNADGSMATGFANGIAEPVRTLATPDEAFRRYLGVEFAFDKRLSARWSLYATYTLSRLEGTVEDRIGYSFDNPRQAPYEYGFLRGDVRHAARLFLTYDLPYGLSVGLNASYQSGAPFDKLFHNSYYDEYVDRRASRGFDPGDPDNPNDDVELRLPDRFQVDTRLSWRLKELTEQDIWLVLEVRNVLNQRPAIRVEERALPAGSATSHGQPLELAEPLRATLALRYRF